MGVITSAGIAYFALIFVGMLYFSIVFIGRRHWSGGKDGRAMGGHYALRVFALLVAAGAISVLAAHVFLIRKDVTNLLTEIMVFSTRLGGCDKDGAG